MTAHSLSHKGWSRPPAHRRPRNGLLQLGWPQFWLLVGILSGMLGLVALLFIAYLEVAR
jgi:hypothetical protein